MNPGSYSGLLAFEVEADREAKRLHVLRGVFDWARFPALATIFENRSRENVYWQELADFFARLPTDFSSNAHRASYSAGRAQGLEEGKKTK